MLQIRCKNNNIAKSFPEGITLLEVLKEFPELQFKYPVVCARVNNTIQGLKFRLFQNRDIEFVDMTSRFLTIESIHPFPVLRPVQGDLRCISRQPPLY